MSKQYIVSAPAASFRVKIPPEIFLILSSADPSMQPARVGFHHPQTTTRAGSRHAPSQWETSLQSNAVSHWFGANLESVLRNGATKLCKIQNISEYMKRHFNVLTSVYTWDLDEQPQYTHLTVYSYGIGPCKLHNGYPIREHPPTHRPLSGWYDESFWSDTTFMAPRRRRVQGRFY